MGKQVSAHTVKCHLDAHEDFVIGNVRGDYYKSNRLWEIDVSGKQHIGIWFNNYRYSYAWNALFLYQDRQYIGAIFFDECE